MLTLKDIIRKLVLQPHHHGLIKTVKRLSIWNYFSVHLIKQVDICEAIFEVRDVSTGLKTPLLAILWNLILAINKASRASMDHILVES